MTVMYDIPRCCAQKLELKVTLPEPADGTTQAQPGATRQAPADRSEIRL